MDPNKGRRTRRSVVATLRAAHRQAAGWQPGERVAEIPVAENAGRVAHAGAARLPGAEQEGLPASGKRGYGAPLLEADVRTAIEMRGTLEGLAARHLAERGWMPQDIAAPLRECNRRGADILAKGHLLTMTWPLEPPEQALPRHAGELARCDRRCDRAQRPPALRLRRLIALDRSALPAEYEKLHRATAAPAGIRRAGAARVGARRDADARARVVGFRYWPAVRRAGLKNKSPGVLWTGARAGLWSGWRDSNSRPLAPMQVRYQAALHPRRSCAL